MSGRRFGSRLGAVLADRARSKAHMGVRPRIESLEDRRLLATFTVTNTEDLLLGVAVPGSLRDAIQKANLAGGADTIKFQIAGTGVHTIVIGPTPLPSITDALTIDGTTQPGFSDHPVIELNGSSAGVGANGLTLQAANVVVKGLAIGNFSGRGISINSSSDTVQLCFIGTDATGTQAAPNGGAGIFLNSASFTQIGGFGAGLSLGNLLSSNTGSGILINGASSTNNTIVGNFIGTSSSGGGGSANGGDGITIQGGSFNIIGGSTNGMPNVISGNKNNGITIIGSTASSNSILGNYIGVDGSPITGLGGLPSGGNFAIPNGQAGIDIQQGASRTFIGNKSDNSGNIISGNGAAGIFIENGPNTTIAHNIIGADYSGTKSIGNLGAGISVTGGDGTAIGGTLDGAANIIAFNGGASTQLGGVNIQSAKNVSILTNSIFSNFGKGIDLSNGANNVQAYPVLTQAATAAGRTLVQGTLDSTANSVFLVQFFTNSTQGAGGFGQGETLLGQMLVSTDASGHADINVTFSTPSNIGYFVSATATDAAGDTSEFSQDAQVVKANQASLTLSASTSPPVGSLGSDLTYTMTITNGGPDPATSVLFDQVLPAGLTYKANSAPAGVNITPSSTGVHGDIGTIASGSQVVFTITVTPTAVGSLTTTATVVSNEIDPNSSDNTVSVTTRVDIPADLNVSLTPKTPSVTVGQNLSIIAKVMDAGPGSTSGTVLRVQIPSNVSFVSASAGQNGATFSNGVVTANLGVLASGSAIPVLIVVTAPMDVPVSGDLTFSATVTADQIDPNPSDNTASLAVPVDPSSDLALSFVANPAAVLSGQNITYNYTVVNNGLSPSNLVTLKDVVPAGVNFIAAPPPSQGTASFATDADGVTTITVQIGSLSPGASASGTIILEKDTTGRVDNTATVTGLEPDPDTTNNSVTVSTLVDPVDVSATIQASPDPASVGKNLTYTIFVNNAGPASATNVKLVDALPAGVTFVSAVSSQGTVSESNGVVTANLGTLTSNASVPITIVVVPTASGDLTNSVVASSDQTETNANNNTASSSTLVNPADVAVQMSVSPSIPLPGDPITYTIFVSNNSDTFTATNVNLSDLLPTGLQLVSATTSLGSVANIGNLVSADIGTLLPQGSATIIIVATALTDGTYDNSATVTSDQIDPDTSNNTADSSVVVTNGPGVLQFAATSFTADENAGVAVITVSRVSGNSGPVTVQFSTSNGTGLAGINYKATAGTLTFNNGELSKTFTIPLIDDGVVNGATTVNLSLTTPTGGAVLGSNASATLVIGESDFDVTGPTITNVQPLGTGKFVTGVILQFSEALDPARASNLNNYALFTPTKGGGQVLVGLLTPTYDATAHTVTLTTTQRLPLNTFYRISVNGSSSTGVADIFDNLLQGTGAGNGQDYVATFARGSSLKYTDQNGDLVTLNITNGAQIDLYRAANGEGQVLRVLGGSRRSVLSGNVRRGGFNSDGVTTFESIVGAGFGRVNSKLTTPKFYSNEVSAFIKGSGVKTAAVTASSIALPSVSAASYTAPIVHAKAHAKLFARHHARKFHH